MLKWIKDHMPNIRYLRTKSLSWWVGAASIGLGVAQIAGLDDPKFGEIGKVIAALAGGYDSSAAGLIVLGAGLIGIRDKMERG